MEPNSDDPTVVNLGDAGKVRQSNVRQIIQTVAATAGVLGLGGTAGLEGLEYTLVSDSQIEGYQAHIASLEADKATLLTRNAEQAAAHTKAYNAMLCEWAFVKRCNGELISTQVGGGVCAEILANETCPTR